MLWHVYFSVYFDNIMNEYFSKYIMFEFSRKRGLLLVMSWVLILPAHMFMYTPPTKIRCDLALISGADRSRTGFARL